ncbi:DUF2971 domain-containing protein [Leifsonia sp. Le1]|uniref:DUF2971 domain-containing protein n=1 Tax=Leifsonia sp. Le1 TaxID=3404918 RepID=UPI003EB8F693
MSMNIASSSGWVPIPHPQPLRNTRAFHYTNARGLIGIVERHRLWASSTLALNDLSEVRYGIEVVRSAVESRTGSASTNLKRMLDDEDFAPLTRGSYVVSASSHGDSLSQWVAYAGNLGYAIEVDTSQKVDRVDGIKPEEVSGSLDQLADSFTLSSGWWYPVTYDRAKQLETVRHVLDVLDEHDFAAPAQLYVPISLCITTFKDSAFENEQEVRFITGRGLRDKFREGRFGVVPYAEVASSDEANPRLPIRSVVIGPLDHDEHDAAEATVRSLLDNNGYAEADVRFSRAPYRF